MSHIRRFKCTEPVCQYPPFVSPQALQRHVKRCHSRETPRTSIRQRMSGSQHRMAPTPAPRLGESQTKPDIVVENGSSSLALYNRETDSTGYMQDEISAQPSPLQPSPARHPRLPHPIFPHPFTGSDDDLMSPEKSRLTSESPQTAHHPLSHYKRTVMGLGGSSRAYEQSVGPALGSSGAPMPNPYMSGYLSSKTPRQRSLSPNSEPPGCLYRLLPRKICNSHVRR